jgi:S-DNA-T family DNA segregation ATPase FtsK/SpoIIIE
MTATTLDTPEPPDDDRPDLHLVADTEPDTQPEAPATPPAPAGAAPDTLDDLTTDDADSLDEEADAGLVDDLDGLEVDDPGAVLVDTAVVSAPPVVLSERRPVLPPWMATPAARLSAARWAVDEVWHRVRFHGLRLPVYAFLLLVAWPPVGFGRLVAAVYRWTVDTSGAEMRRSMAQAVKEDPRSADALARVRVAHRRDTYIRAGFVSGLCLALLVAGLILMAAAPTATMLVGLGVLGVAGRPSGRSRLVIGRATAVSEVPPLTSELIVAALAALGLGKMNAALRGDDGDAVRFATPVQRSGAGWRVDIDLPIGTTADEVIKRRSSLASGLRRPLGCVWPSGDDTVHEGRLVLYVSDKPLSARPPRRWPLADRSRANIFGSIPIGVDVRGEPVTVCLMYACAVLGALPRMGKTFLLRLLCLAAGLDPRVELHIYNLKGGSDFDPFAGPEATTDPTKGIVYAYRSGDDLDDIKAALADLRSVQAEMRRRSKLLRTLPRDICPDSKVTDELASRPELRLHPIVIAADEVQRWFEHPEYGAELETVVTDLVKRGPALAIIVLVATQRPDAGSLPSGIRDNAVLRFCLKVTSHIANDMVLGTGMHAAGYSATMFGRFDRGVAILAGEGDDPVIVQIDKIDGPAADRIVARARAARQAAGLLSAGELVAPDDDSASILDRLFGIWPDNERKTTGKVWCSVLADRLAEAHPNAFEGWTAEQVTAAVRPFGINSIQVKRRGQNRNGIAWADLVQALADRTDLDDDTEAGEGDQ